MSRQADLTPMIYEPGMLMVDWEKLKNIFRKAILNDKTVLIYLDFDGTITLDHMVKQFRNNPNFPVENMINFHLADKIAALYKEFGPIIKMEVLSARYPDAYLCDDAVKINTVLPEFLNRVRYQMQGHENVDFVPSKIPVHCIRHWRRFAIITQSNNGFRIIAQTKHFEINRKREALEPQAREEAETILAHYRHKYPTNNYHRWEIEVSKGYYLEYLLGAKLADRNFCIHIDDDAGHLDSTTRFAIGISVFSDPKNLPVPAIMQNSAMIQHASPAQHSSQPQSKAMTERTSRPHFFMHSSQPAFSKPSEDCDASFSQSRST